MLCFSLREAVEEKGAKQNDSNLDREVTRGWRKTVS